MRSAGRIDTEERTRPTAEESSLPLEIQRRLAAPATKSQKEAERKMQKPHLADCPAVCLCTAHRTTELFTTDKGIKKGDENF